MSEVMTMIAGYEISPEKENIRKDIALSANYCARGSVPGRWVMYFYNMNEDVK